MALRTIGVSVRGRAVALWGTVSSYFIKQIAHEVTKTSAGVKSLTNRLTVVVSSVNPMWSDSGTDPGTESA
jgi:osmotically-inducible protein OsmY